MKRSLTDIGQHSVQPSKLWSVTHMTHVTHFPYKCPRYLIPPLVPILIPPGTRKASASQCVMRHWQRPEGPTDGSRLTACRASSAVAQVRH